MDNSYIVSQIPRLMEKVKRANKTALKMNLSNTKILSFLTRYHTLYIYMNGQNIEDIEQSLYSRGIVPSGTGLDVA